MSSLEALVFRWSGSPGTVPEICRADDGALLPEYSSVDLCISPASVKLAIARKFFLTANLSCSTARLSWPLMYRRRTNQLLGLVRGIMSITLQLWVDSRKDAMGTDSLQKRRLLSTFSVSVRLLL